MSTKKPRKTPQAEHLEWMKKEGYSIADMDKFWQENYDTNFVVKNLTDNGYSWRDMNITVVQKLPTQKERDIEYLAKKAEEEEAKRLAELDENQKREYYEKHFEELMCKKIDTQVALTEEELHRLLEYELYEEREYGDDSRWSRGVASIIELCNRHFMLYWQKGLTEMQEDYFCDQPYEVEKVQYEKTIIVKEWWEKGRKENEHNYVFIHSEEN
jgi:hypothetical protein